MFENKFENASDKMQASQQAKPPKLASFFQMAIPRGDRSIIQRKITPIPANHHQQNDLPAPKPEIGFVCANRIFRALMKPIRITRSATRPRNILSQAAVSTLSSREQL